MRNADQSKNEHGIDPSSSDGQPAPRKQPSEAQVRANRENAQKSTGRRTPQGKAKSAANSTKHGIYATKCEAIEVGPYSETAGEIEDCVRDLVEALEPGDVLEQRVASEIALILVRERRLAAWESGQLVGYTSAEDLERLDHRDADDEEILEWIRVWNLDRPNAGAPPDPEGEFPWEVMAALLRYTVKPGVGVKNLWTGTQVPASTSEWRSAFVSLATHHFPTPEDLITWLRGLHLARAVAADERESLARRRVALRSLDVIELSTANRSRLTQEKCKLMAM